MEAAACSPEATVQSLQCGIGQVAGLSRPQRSAQIRTVAQRDRSRLDDMLNDLTAHLHPLPSNLSFLLDQVLFMYLTVKYAIDSSVKRRPCRNAHR